MRRDFAVAMLIIGCIVGAGFTSGVEIVYFFGGFGEYAFIAIVFSAALMGALCALFMLLAQRFHPSELSELHKYSFSKAHSAADFLIITNSMIVGANMLACLGVTQRQLFNQSFPFLPILACFLALAVLKNGAKGLIKINSIISPLVAISLLLVCIFALSGTNAVESQPFNAIYLPMPLIYSSINIILSCGVLSTIKITKKSTIFHSCAIGSTIILALMLLIFYSAKRNMVEGENMPILAILSKKSRVLYYFMLVITLAAVFTSLLSSLYNVSLWLKSLCKYAFLARVLAILISFFFSFLGFEYILKYLTPAFGVLGLGYILVNLRLYIKTIDKPLLKPLAIRK